MEFLYLIRTDHLFIPSKVEKLMYLENVKNIKCMKSLDDEKFFTFVPVTEDLLFYDCECTISLNCHLRKVS